MKKEYEYLKACGVCHLTTTDGDQPHVRLFGTIDLFEDKLYNPDQQGQACLRPDECHLQGRTV